jgi:hypothetical protein
LRPVLLAIAVKTAALWWSVGPLSVLALAALLLGAAIVKPIAATLTWPLLFAIGLLGVILRLAAIGLSYLRPRWRVPAAAIALASAAYFIGVKLETMKPHSPATILHTREARGEPDLCAVIGYSTAGGASLRGSLEQRGLRGVRSFLDMQCPRCSGATGAIAGSGETLDWMKEAYCSSPSSFGGNGQVVFLGGANDDFLWGVTTVARLFIVGQRSVDAWRSSQAPATAASLARIDEQVSAIDGLVRCARDRGASFLFLHDFLVTDLTGGREPDRAAMLARRRQAVEAAGGTFVDLFDTFSAEAGVSWFNDYVHPSLVAHERIADLACRAFP